MQVHTLRTAGWNESLITLLSTSGVVGVELQWASTTSTLDEIADEMDHLFGAPISRQKWLLIGHDLAQPDSRLVRHRGIWKSLGIDSKSVPLSEISEWCVEYADGIRFFGAVRATLEDFREEILRIWVNEPNCWMVYAPKSTCALDFSSWLSGGWAGVSLMPQAVLLEAAVQRGLALVRCIDVNQQAMSCLAVGAPSAIPLVGSPARRHN